jgi:hypothetical protein
MSEGTGELQPGQTLDGRFVITGVICKTGTATVFKANDLLTARDVALKAPFFRSELGSPQKMEKIVRWGF